MTRRTVPQPEVTGPLAELHRRADRAISEARQLCEEERRMRLELRGRIADLRRSIAGSWPSGDGEPEGA